MTVNPALSEPGGALAWSGGGGGGGMLLPSRGVGGLSAGNAGTHGSSRLSDHGQTWVLVKTALAAACRASQGLPQLGLESPPPVDTRLAAWSNPTVRKGAGSDSGICGGPPLRRRRRPIQPE